MGIQINGNTNNINAGIGSLSIEDLNELDIVGVATAANFKTGSSNLHTTGLTVGNNFFHSTGINVGTGATIHVPSSNVLTLGTNSSERLRIDAYGRVLIGGTSAIIGSSSEFNEIVLTGKTRGAGITLQDVDANTRFQIRTDDNGEGTLLNASTNHPIAIRTNNIERLSIASDGKVLIGNGGSYNAGAALHLHLSLIHI